MTTRHHHPHAQKTQEEIHDLAVKIRGITGKHTLVIGGPFVDRWLHGSLLSQDKVRAIGKIADQIESLMGNGGHVEVSWGDTVFDPEPKLPRGESVTQSSSSTSTGPNLPVTCPICEPREYVA